MKSAIVELKKLRLISEKYLNKTEQLDKLLSQIEVRLSRAESLKVLNEKKLINSLIYNHSKKNIYLYLLYLRQYQ